MKYTLHAAAFVALMIAGQTYTGSKPVNLPEPDQKHLKVDTTSDVSTFRVFTDDCIAESKILARYSDKSCFVGYLTSFEKDNTQQSGWRQEWTMIFKSKCKKEVLKEIGRY